MSLTVQDVLKERKIPFSCGVLGAAVSSFRIGGQIGLLIEPRCCGELIEAVCICRELGLSFEMIGAATNILFDDGVIDTVLIRTVRLDAVSVAHGRMHALCGVPLPLLAVRAAEEGLGGLCFACGIPGTLGGAIFMNAGAHGGEIGDVIERVEVFLPDGRKRLTLDKHELGFAYRDSVFQHGGMVILSATLGLRAGGDPAFLKQQIKELRAARRAAQPIGQPSAGSVFRRPAPDIAIARIIDELGLKGVRVGGAEISGQHAGFIVNTGGATASDVRTLIEKIQNIVERERGIRPEVEIRFIPSEK